MLGLLSWLHQDKDSHLLPHRWFPLCKQTKTMLRVFTHPIVPIQIYSVHSHEIGVLYLSWIPIETHSICLLASCYL